MGLEPIIMVGGGRGGGRRSYLYSFIIIIVFHRDTGGKPRNYHEIVLT